MATAEPDKPSEPHPAQGDSRNFLFAVAQLKRGYSVEEVKNQLAAQGVPDEKADELARSAARANRNEVRRAGLRNMEIGGFVFLAGVAVTVGSYFLAAAIPGMEKFVIAGGALVFGLLQFLYGLIQAVFGST